MLLTNAPIPRLTDEISDPETISFRGLDVMDDFIGQGHSRRGPLAEIRIIAVTRPPGSALGLECGDLAFTSDGSMPPSMDRTMFAASFPS